jgi:glycosyltransferase involved in cell wall biosynthesis
LSEQIVPNQTPGVGVVIPTHNRPDRLARALNAVLTQDYAGAVSCIVVFDQERPSRPSVDIPPRRRIHLLENVRSAGPGGARNTGVLSCDDAMLAFCDDDDVWQPGKLTKQVARLVLDPRLSSVASGIVVESKKGRRAAVPPRDVIRHADLCSSRIASAHMSTVVTTRQAFGRIGPFDEAVPGGYSEDYDWLLRSARVGPVGIVREPLVVVSKGASYFERDYESVASAIEYLLQKHPCLMSDRRNAARMMGRIAFARAALGQPRDALTWAGRSLQSDWRQPRGILAAAVAARLCSPARVATLAERFGKGI